MIEVEEQISQRPSNGRGGRSVQVPRACKDAVEYAKKREPQVYHLRDAIGWRTSGSHPIQGNE